MGSRLISDNRYSNTNYFTSKVRNTENDDDMIAKFQQSKSEQIHSGHAFRLAGYGIGMCSILAEHLLSHPCIVLRRQCQVHHHGHRSHLTPVTLLQTMLNLQQSQGCGTFYKGISGTFVVKGVNLLSETVISEMTPLPKEVSRRSHMKKYGKHLLLKMLAYMITTPFYSASLIETVQDRTVTVADADNGALCEQYFTELLSFFAGNLLADGLLFPLETVLHRLYVQGTRTIIDNMDTGIGLVPVSTRYEGVIDCFCCIWSEEGVQGFYRGLGALILQYAAHAAILRLARLLFDHMSTMLSTSVPTTSVPTTPASQTLLRQRQQQSISPPPSQLFNADFLSYFLDTHE